MREGDEKKKTIARQQFEEELQRIEQEELERLTALKDAQKSGLAVSDDDINTVRSQADMQRFLALQKLQSDMMTIAQDGAAMRQRQQEEEADSWVMYNKQFGDYNEKRLADRKSVV